MRITVAEREAIRAVVNNIIWDRFRGWAAVDEAPRADQLAMIEQNITTEIVSHLDFSMHLLSSRRVPPRAEGE